ncbi:MAG: type II secretion system protein GspD, partial [Thiothrix sp.]
MKYRGSIVGLVSVAVLMSACTSIQGSPGYRQNIKKVGGFQRSDAVKELDPATVGLVRPVLRPADDNAATLGYPEVSQTIPAWETLPAAEPRSTNSNKDVELILGDQQYYRNDVKRPSLG